MFDGWAPAQDEIITFLVVTTAQAGQSAILDISSRHFAHAWHGTQSPRTRGTSCHLLV